MTTKTIKHPLSAWHFLEVLLFIGPAAMFLIVFWILPILGSLGVSFTDWDFMSDGFQITGIQNYRSLLRDKNFLSAMEHTLLFACYTVLPGCGIGLILAVLVHAAGRHTPYAACLLAPWITPTVAVSIVWIWIFEPDRGLANGLLQWLGLRGLPWLQSSSTALAAVSIVTVWKNLGYVMLLFLGPLSQIPKEYYEAAALDGAGVLQRFRKITLPLLAPSTCFVGLIMTVESLRAYDQIQILTQGGPAGSTRTLLYLYYQLGFEQFRMGQAAAAVVILTIIGLFLAWVQNRVKGVFYEI
ncbi:MAG: sugar ABC transporter permease [Lachnospiraceae bacterium]|nr:sugar ABC transporter permease [Lachnospiraceae bacterium]